MAILNGTPYFAFRDGGNSSKATVMQFNGSNWVAVGNAGFTPGNVGGLSLKISNGVPYLAFEDGNQALKASVMKFKGTSWVPKQA